MSIRDQLIGFDADAVRLYGKEHHDRLAGELVRAKAAMQYADPMGWCIDVPSGAPAYLKCQDFGLIGLGVAYSDTVDRPCISYDRPDREPVYDRDGENRESFDAVLADAQAEHEFWQRGA